MTNLCGSCTMCCKIMGVTELKKPVNIWCGHVCKGQGCGIYDSRPQTCAEYECVWLTMAKEGPIPEEWRPDKSKVIMNNVASQEDVMMVMVDPGYPQACRRDDIQQFLARVADKGIRVVIGIAGSTNKILMQKQGNHVTMKSIKLSPVDENGVQFYEPEK